MKVAVLMGGRSAEREVSLMTGRGIAASLRQLGHDVQAIDAVNGQVLPEGREDEAPGLAASDSVEEFHWVTADGIRSADVVFVALHGGAGENGTMQALLELAAKPYTGSGVMASALAMNKAMSKKLFEREGIPTPPWQLISADAGPDDLDVDRLGGYPIVVKPNEGGSTVALTIVHQGDALEAALRVAAEHGHETLIERFIPGREMTVAVLGDEALPIVEIRPRSGLYDYESKYTSGMSEYECPARLPEALAARVMDFGRRASRTLGCTGVSRADFRLSPEDEPFCLEVNTIPGMTPTSLVPMAAKARGMSYDQLVERSVELAVAENRRRRRHVATGA
jgi:D-alanine-D-alanine ligase